MNFFEHQDRARKKTKLLLLYFLLAVILIIVSIDCMLVFLTLYTDGYVFYALVTPPGTMIMPPSMVKFAQIQDFFIFFLPYVAGAVIMVIFTGTLYRLFHLRAGGIAVADMANATLIDPNTSDLNEQKLINVVEEMSIASGTPVPKLYIMHNEPGINAFVAGIKPSDTVMVVTAGALQQLTRDELQGVIAHEYSHIFNGDMSISVRLIGLLAGILLIGQLGAFILRSLFRQRSSRSKNAGGAFAILLLGAGLYLIGYIGLFFGRLIKAAVSRQRETLADACSVQFTRNPSGLVNALQKIGQSATGTALNTRHAEDLNHLCFCPSLSMFFSRWLATHPPLEDRIRAIDPQKIYRSTTAHSTPAPSGPNDKAGINISNSIGHPSVYHMALAVEILHQLPDTLRALCRQTQQVEILYYALFLLRDFSLYADKKSTLLQWLSDIELQHATDYAYQIRTLDPRTILPLVDISLPAFQAKPLAQRQKIFKILCAIAKINKLDLFEFTLLGIIRKYTRDPTVQWRPKYDQLTSVSAEIEILFSYIISAGRLDEATQNIRFEKVAQALQLPHLTRRPITAIDPKALLPVLSTLNRLTPLCKQTLIDTCLAILQSDEKITLSEAELFRGIAACLDCPVPPILPNA